MSSSTRPPRIGLVTCLALPEPDADEARLLGAVQALGADARVLAWDDPEVAWGELDLAVIRSTWNYYHRLEAFLGWAEATARVTRLANPVATIRWNTHKRYLLELAARGAPVVPTELLPRGGASTLAEVRARRGWTDCVLKPAVSAGSFDTHRLTGDDAAAGEATLARMATAGDVLVQGYVRSVEGYGERSMIFIEGALSHAIRKSPRFAGGHEQVSGTMPIADDERRTAEAVLAGLPEPLLYARVDLARDEAGRPMVMELELVEPSLFLGQHPPSLDRFARAILARAR